MFPERLYSFVLLLMVLNGNGLGNETTELTSESMCYWTNTSYDDKCVEGNEPRPLDVRYRNGYASGVVIAEVCLPPRSCGFTRFHVVLSVEKEVSVNQPCTNGRRSWRTYTRLRCDSDNCPNTCGKFTNFTFHQVKTGVYHLNVLAYYAWDDWNEYESQPTKIVTNYHKSWGTHLIYEVEPSIQRDIVNFQFAFSTPISEVFISLIDANKENVGEISVESFNYKPTMKENCNITLERNTARHIGKITAIKCAHNASATTKSLQVSFPNEDVCDNVTRYSRDRDAPGSRCICWRERALELTTRKEELPETELSSLYTSLAVIMVFVVGGIAVVIVNRARRRRRLEFFPFQSGKGQEIPTLDGDIEILLLYPRDCPQFMKLMTSLKIFIETTYQIQVYDCYDKYSREILHGPEEWFQSLMARKILRIIIVTTECACHLQEAYFSNTKATYRQLEFHDHFFMYAMSHILRDSSQDAYRKIYVVQISGFSDDVELKFVPTALTRYKLPEHLEKLLKDMSATTCDGVYIEMDCQMKGRAYEDFVKSLEDLKSFKIENKEYLRQTLELREARDPCL